MQETNNPTGPPLACGRNQGRAAGHKLRRVDPENPSLNRPDGEFGRLLVGFPRISARFLDVQFGGFLYHKLA